MNWTSKEILKILDDCAKSFTFPVLDNEYVYLAATRMSLFRSETDWAIVIEVFGFSPRSGIPDTQLYTFSSSLCNRNTASDYVSKEAYENYLKNNPYNEGRFIYPIENEDWLDEENPEKVKWGGIVTVRGRSRGPIPLEMYEQHQIELEENTPWVFELTRLLAAIEREGVFAQGDEKRISISPEMVEIMVLDEWHHPDWIGGELPSGNETFQQLAKVLTTGDISAYRPSKKPNTAWENWPESGLL